MKGPLGPLLPGRSVRRHIETGRRFYDVVHAIDTPDMEYLMAHIMFMKDRLYMRLVKRFNKSAFRLSDIHLVLQEDLAGFVGMGRSALRHGDAEAVRLIYDEVGRRAKEIGYAWERY